MKKMVIIGAGLVALLAGACGGNSDGSSTPTQAPAQPTATTGAAQPSPTTQAATADLDLKSMALSLNDLPAGATLKKEGPGASGLSSDAFSREFDVSGVRVGSSSIALLGCEIDAFKDSGAASAMMSLMATAATNDQAKPLLANQVGAALGVKADVQSVEVISGLSIGQQASGLLVRMTTPDGPQVAYVIGVRVDRVVGEVFAMAADGKVEQSDIVSLANAMAAHMSKALGQ